MDAITVSDHNPVPVEYDTAAALGKSVEQLREVVPVLVQELRKIQQRMAEMEAREQQITLSHAEVRIIQQLIRNRSYEYCEKYGILSPGSLRSINAGIKRAVLNRYKVKDLHDVPAIARQAVEAQISRWSDSRLMARCREKMEKTGTG